MIVFIICNANSELNLELHEFDLISALIQV